MNDSLLLFLLNKLSLLLDISAEHDIILYSFIQLVW